MFDLASSNPPLTDNMSDETGDRGDVFLFKRQPGKPPGGSATTAGAGVFSKPSSASAGAATSATKSKTSSATATPTVNASQAGREAMEAVIRLHNLGGTIGEDSVYNLTSEFVDSIYNDDRHREITDQLTSLNPQGNYTEGMNAELDNDLAPYRRLLDKGKVNERAASQNGALSTYNGTGPWPDLTFSEEKESSAGSGSGGNIGSAVTMGLLTAAGVAAAQNWQGIGGL